MKWMQLTYVCGYVCMHVYVAALFYCINILLIAHRCKHKTQTPYTAARLSIVLAWHASLTGTPLYISHIKHRPWFLVWQIYQDFSHLRAFV